MNWPLAATIFTSVTGILFLLVTVAIVGTTDDPTEVRPWLIAFFINLALWSLVVGWLA